MTKKQRKKAVKELREEIIPHLKARNLINNPDKNLRGQKVYRAIEIFRNFDCNTGENLDKMVKEFLDYVRAGTREKYVENLANDIVNYVSQKTDGMDIYKIENKNKFTNGTKLKTKKSFNWTAFFTFLLVVIGLITYISYKEYWKKNITAKRPVLSLKPVKFEENDLFILYNDDRLEVEIQVENKGETPAIIEKPKEIEFRIKAPEMGQDTIIEDYSSSCEKNNLAKEEKTGIGLIFEPKNKEAIDWFKDDRAYFYIKIKLNYTGDPGFFDKKCYISKVFEVKNNEVVLGPVESECY